jgi:hypothetical protein
MLFQYFRRLCLMRSSTLANPVGRLRPAVAGHFHVGVHDVIEEPLAEKIQHFNPKVFPAGHEPLMKLSKLVKQQIVFEPVGGKPFVPDAQHVRLFTPEMISRVLDQLIQNVTDQRVACLFRDGVMQSVGDVEYAPVIGVDTFMSDCQGV